MTEEDKQRFFFEGQFYENQEEFEKAVYYYYNSKATNATAEKFLEAMCKDISLNIFYSRKGECSITNGVFIMLCENAFINFMQKYSEYLEKKDNSA